MPARLGKVGGGCKCLRNVLAAGTALVGDFSKAVPFDRQSLNVSLGTINDQFVRNLVMVLGDSSGLRCHPAECLL